MAKLIIEKNQIYSLKMSGGRGSSIKYIFRINDHTTRKLIFDEPHPGNNLYSYQIEKVIEFLKIIGEIN